MAMQLVNHPPQAVADCKKCVWCTQLGAVDICLFGMCPANREESLRMKYEEQYKVYAELH